MCHSQGTFEFSVQAASLEWTATDPVKAEAMPKPILTDLLACPGIINLARK